MIKQITFLLLLIAISNKTIGQVINTSYKLPNGERVLQLSIMIPLQKSEAWQLFASDSGLVKWIAPVAKIDLKTGGSIKTNYDKQKGLNDKSTIKLGIINFLNEELMTLKVNLNGSFSKKIQAEDRNLQEIIQLFDMGNGQTKIVSTMLGWGKGEDWEKTYTFFEKGNTWTYKEILKLFQK